MKCYEIQKKKVDGPWVDGQALWQRVPTVNPQHATWEDVCLGLLRQGKTVACKVCGVRPGQTWKTCLVPVATGMVAGQMWVCDAHLESGAVSLVET